MPIFIQVVICAGFFMVLAFLYDMAREMKAVRKSLYDIEMRLRKANREPPFEEDHSEGEWRYQNRSNSN